MFSFNALTGKLDLVNPAPDLSGYALLAGRSGGQTLIGDTASGGNLTLQSTSNATKGKILFGTSVYDEVNNRLGIGTTSPLMGLDIPAYTTTNSGLRIGSIEFQSYALNNVWFSDNIYYNSGFKRRNAGYGTLFYMQNGTFQVRTVDTGAIGGCTPVQHFIITQEGNVGIAGNQTSGGLIGSVLTVLNSGNVGIGTTSPTSRIHGVTTLSAATGNEVAFQLNYTTNKLTSGNDTGLVINQTDTASPGTSNLLDLQVGGVSKFSVSNVGAVNIIGALTTNGGLQTFGANDSGGAGFRMVVVPNV